MAGEATMAGDMFEDAGCVELAMDYDGNACLLRTPWHSLATQNNADYHTDFASQFDDGDSVVTNDGGMSPYTCGFLLDDDALSSPPLHTSLTPPSSSDAGSACDSSYDFSRFGQQIGPTSDYTLGAYQGYADMYHQQQNFDQYAYSSNYFVRPSQPPQPTIDSLYPQETIHNQALPSSPPNYATLMAVGGPAAYASWKASNNSIPMTYASVSTASLSPYGFLSGVTGDRCVKGKPL